jgi:tellurite methyltransferase
MLRAMRGFHEDQEGHWVAELSCGHSQHVRHQPPFTLRPWTLTAEGRVERIGQQLDCVLCDRREIPAGHVAYKRTASFRRETIPAGLLQHHDTKPGVWAILTVSRGNLEFFETGANGETRTALGAGATHVIVPEVQHRVAAQGDVEFSVEFWRAVSE